MSNPTRICPACGKEDNHPRCCHQMPDLRWADYHYDCCAPLGCENARLLIADRPDGAIGEAMREHVIAAGPAVVAELTANQEA